MNKPLLTLILTSWCGELMTPTTTKKKKHAQKMIPFISICTSPYTVCRGAPSLIKVMFTKRCSFTHSIKIHQQPNRLVGRASIRVEKLKRTA